MASGTLRRIALPTGNFTIIKSFTANAALADTTSIFCYKGKYLINISLQPRYGVPVGLHVAIRNNAGLTYDDGRYQQGFYIGSDQLTHWTCMQYTTIYDETNTSSTMYIGVQSSKSGEIYINGRYARID